MSDEGVQVPQIIHSRDASSKVRCLIVKLSITGTLLPDISQCGLEGTMKGSLIVKYLRVNGEDVSL